MSQEFELNPIQEAGTNGEVSTEAVEALAEQIRETAQAIAANAKDEGRVQKSNTAITDLLIKLLKSQDHKLLQFIFNALRENNPPALILAAISPLYSELWETLPAEGEAFFLDEAWPENKRPQLQKWEKIMLSSLQELKAEFQENFKTKGEQLPALEKLLNQILLHLCPESPVEGGHIIEALITHTA
jgi:hypothetical protein